MGRAQHEVARRVDEGCLGLCVGTPKEEYEVLALGGKGTDGGVGERLPSPSLVRGCLPTAHGESGVEQHDTLLCPPSEVARCGGRHAQFGLNLGVDVLERRRQGHTLGHGERQSHGLTRLVVGVLAEDDYFHTVEGCRVESIKDLAARRIARPCRIFLAHEGCQFGEVGLVELGL